MTSQLYIKNSITTFSGKIVNVFDPDPDTIVIEDIAHALSFMPRFGGHLPELYSVAQHSVSCMILVDDEFKLEALLHDSTEAYIMDMPKPIKMNMPEYQKIEENLQRVISKKFGVPFPMSPEIKKIDKEMLELEWKILMLGVDRHKMPCKPSTEARDEFLKAFRQYRNVE